MIYAHFLFFSSRQIVCCVLCPEEFATLSLLQMHMMVDHDYIQCSAEHCMYYLNSVDALTHHLRTIHHQRESVTVDVSTSTGDLTVADSPVIIGLDDMSPPSPAQSTDTIHLGPSDVPYPDDDDDIFAFGSVPPPMSSSPGPSQGTSQTSQSQSTSSTSL